MAMRDRKNFFFDSNQARRRIDLQLALDMKMVAEGVEDPRQADADGRFQGVPGRERGGAALPGRSLTASQARREKCLEARTGIEPI